MGVSQALLPLRLTERAVGTFAVIRVVADDRAGALRVVELGVAKA